MSAPLYQPHDYWKYPNAYSIVNEWWKARGKGVFPENLLPKVGVLVTGDDEPLAALWLYMAVDIGVAFAEYPVTKPGLGIRAKEPMLTAINAVKAIAKVHNYGIIRVATLPRIARFLEREGWTREDDEPRIPLMIKT